MAQGITMVDGFYERFRSSISRPGRVAAAAALACGLALGGLACGKKGPLYLPEEGAREDKEAADTRASEPLRS
jgi:predicted small lipoprotein YifL